MAVDIVDIVELTSLSFFDNKQHSIFRKLYNVANKTFLIFNSPGRVNEFSLFRFVLVRTIKLTN